MGMMQWYPRACDNTFAFVDSNKLTDTSLVFEVYARNAEGLADLVLSAEDEAHAAAVANALNAAFEARP